MNCCTLRPARYLLMHPQRFAFLILALISNGYTRAYSKPPEVKQEQMQKARTTSMYFQIEVPFARSIDRTWGIWAGIIRHEVDRGRAQVNEGHIEQGRNIYAAILNSGAPAQSLHEAGDAVVSSFFGQVGVQVDECRDWIASHCNGEIQDVVNVAVARRLYRMQELESSLTIVGPIIREHNACSAMASEVAAACYLSQGKRDECMAVLNEAVDRPARSGEHAGALLMLARVYSQKQDYEKALSMCERLLSECPENPHALAARHFMKDLSSKQEVVLNNAVVPTEQKNEQ